MSRHLAGKQYTTHKIVISLKGSRSLRYAPLIYQFSVEVFTAFRLSGSFQSELSFVAVIVLFPLSQRLHYVSII